MTTLYTPAWSQGDAAGRVSSAQSIRRVDLDEIAAAINRRRRLVIQTPFRYGPVLDTRPYVSQYVIDDSRDNGDTPGVEYALAMRRALVGSGSNILTARPGMDGLYNPPYNPLSIAWLWPEPDADEDKVIRSWLPSTTDTEVSLFTRLNGSATWTPASLAPRDLARAVHLNELRQVTEWLRRGRWVLPLYWYFGLFTRFPGSEWIGDTLGNDGSTEIRSVGAVRFHVREELGGGYGLWAVRARSVSISWTCSVACQVELRHLLRPIRFDTDRPSWSYYANVSQLPWTTPGAVGAGDSVVIRSPISAAAGVPVTLTGDDLLPVVQSMLNGETPSFFLLRQLSTRTQTTTISNATMTLDFDLTSPPA